LGESSVPLRSNFWPQTLTLFAGKNYPENHNLVWVMSRTMLKPFAAAVFPRLAFTFFRFMQPFLIYSITKLVEDPYSVSVSVSDRGWGLTAAFGLVYIGLAVTGGAYQHQANRMATMVRGSLVNAIYAQTLELSITSLDESAAVTLMSSDVERICESLLSIHSLWAGPMEIALAIWLLQKQIGIALLGPLLITAVAVSGPFLISRPMGNAQKSWIEKIQTRVDGTAKVLQAMKGLKMLGLTAKTSTIIYKLRLNEVAKSLKMRKLFIAMIAFGNMSDIFAPGAAFALYVIIATVNGQTLDVTSAFTALSLISLLVNPIRVIVFSTPPVIAAFGCFDRIQAFLSLPTKKDHRILQLPQSQGQISEFMGLDISMGSNIELRNITPQVLTSSTPVTIRAQNLTLSWTQEDGPLVVDDFSFDFKSENLTIIVGPVGSGKSSLLCGLLGETPASKGNVYINRANAAFVSQIPWIQNTTIRNNIIGISAFEPEWYETVLHACAFDIDIEILPERDHTVVGSAGTAISGGQRLRLVSYLLFIILLMVLTLDRRLHELFIHGNRF
jgi:ATP-binding cassette subfamily C (CFTR/MRP) protein 1